MKFGIYASARNEEPNIADWLAAVADADCVAVVDNGSTDGTPLKLLDAWEAGKLTHIKKMEPPTNALSDALNVVMDLLPNDCDLILRLDLDERLQPGWRNTLEHLALDGPTIIRPWFDHAGLLYRHTRIHTRHGFRWELPVHEVLAGAGALVDVEMTIEHHQDPTKDRSGVLQELRDALDADPTNLRLQHYLGREYTYVADWGHAIPLLRAHANSDAYPEERSESWRLLGDCYAALMDAQDVPQRPYRMATYVCPERREGFVALANFCMQRGWWIECLANAERALAITERSWYFNQPWAWGAKPYDLAALASWYLGLTDDALRYGAQACELEPDDERLATNLAYYRRELVTA